jgi:polyisoprenoid-binding protein YceI
MNTLTIRALPFLAGVILPLLGAVLPTATAYAADYRVDPDHTKIGFSVKHLGISNVTGKFNNFEGEFRFDPENISEASASAKIKTKSVDTDHEKRDEHLRSPDFFNVEKQPLLSFTSTEIKNISGKKFTVLGDLSINGIKKPIELQAEYLGSVKDPWGNERAGFSAHASINRKDFGLSWNKLLETGGLLVGETVEIILEVEGIKK